LLVVVDHLSKGGLGVLTSVVAAPFVLHSLAGPGARHQAMRVLMLMLAGLIVVSGFVPAISTAYSTVTGQLVMAALLTFAAVMLVRMRTLSVGKPAPRFLTGGVRS